MARINALQQECIALRQRAQQTDEEHKKTHAELALVRQNQTSKPFEFRHIDPKSMIPEKLGLAGGPKWLGWSEATRAYVEMLSVDLATKMKQIEGIQTPLANEHLDEATLEIPEHHLSQLGRYLYLRAEGNPNTMGNSKENHRETRRKPLQNH